MFTLMFTLQDMVTSRYTNDCKAEQFQDSDYLFSGQITQFRHTTQDTR